MLSLLADFFQELRASGIPVSMVEAIDAGVAIRHIDLVDRAALKDTLAATLVKNARHQPAFDTVFEIYFAGRRPIEPDDTVGERPEAGPGQPAGAGSGELDDLIESVFNAMAGEDYEMLRAVARRAVNQLAGVEPGRPVGGTYYLYRTLRQLGIEALEERLRAAIGGEEEDELDRRFVTQEVAVRINRLREEIQAEIRRRLVEDRGREAVAKTLRQPLVEDMDLMHATRSDLRALDDVIAPLTRKLAARLAQRRKRGRAGRLDFRKTIRAAVAAGGVPIEPKFRASRPHRPEMMLLCDISGSMATFARFTLQLTYAMATHFSRMRAFVFVDAVDEVTDYLTPGTDFPDALARIGSEADVVWLDGHSDYGHAFEQFMSRYGRELTPRATLIITGDARNNYREPRVKYLAEMAAASRAVFWLNPEPRAYWDSGDSVMGRYAGYCDDVYEVRNLRQLEQFVERVALDRPGRIRSTTLRTPPMVKRTI